MNFFIDADYGSLNKYGEELCGDKVEIIRNGDSLIIVLADGLGSGVKANILATLTSKIIGTMLSSGASIDEAVETIVNTLPVCKEREIAYSTFSILQINESGQGYLVEFDNPPIIHLKRGKFMELERSEREINGKLIKESRFTVAPEDMFVMVSDGAIHAGVGQTLNLGWQWDNVREYAERTYRKDISARNYTNLLLSVCENLYAKRPGDDTTVVVVKVRKVMEVNVMIGPPVDKHMDRYIVNKFMSGGGKKVVCGGTTAQIVSRELGKDIVTNMKYFNPSIPPTAEIEGIDLTTEGILTMDRALEYAKGYVSSENTIYDFNKKDGASALAGLLLEESTSVHFFVGRAMNPAHQNPELPLSLGFKLKLVEGMAECLKSLGKQAIIDYY
jgi:hypothetical protein